MPQTVIQDGTLNFGSFVLDITNPGGVSPISCIADNVNPSHPTKVVERTDENDKPDAQRIYSGVATGSAQLQVGTTLIRVGATFAEDLLGLGSDQNWIVSEVSRAFSKDGEMKQNITFRERLGGGAPTVTE